MDREEILAKSRKENRDRDFVEEAVQAKANAIALSVGIIVCGLISILRCVLTDSGGEWAVWIVQFSIMSTVMLVKYARLRKGHELALGLCYLGFAAFFAVVYLRGLLGAG